MRWLMKLPLNLTMKQRSTLSSFFDNLDKGTFDEHKDDWVLVYKQEAKKYGTREKTGKELVDLMPGAIYLLVDKKRRDDLVKSSSARIICILLFTYSIYNKG
jgi:hypothetical protein